MNKSLKDTLKGYGFIAPWLICFLMFTVYPVALSFYYSLTDFDILSEPTFVGLKNYIYIFTRDPKFWNSLKVTMLYAFVSVPLRLIFAFLVALLLAKKHYGQGLYRALFYLPSLVGGSVAIAIVWRTLFGANGAVQAMLESIGIYRQYSLLGDPKSAVWCLILLAVLQFGSPMLTFLAGLKAVPSSYYEAAEIDGATGWRRLIHITLPLISPQIQFNLIMQMITGLMVFTQGYVITDGGPLQSTYFMVLHIYRTTFESYEAGRGCALAWLLLLLLALVTVVIYGSSKYWVFFEGDQS